MRKKKNFRRLSTFVEIYASTSQYCYYYHTLLLWTDFFSSHSLWFYHTQLAQSSEYSLIRTKLWISHYFLFVLVAYVMGQRFGVNEKWKNKTKTSNNDSLKYYHRQIHRKTKHVRTLRINTIQKYICGSMVEHTTSKHTHTDGLSHLQSVSRINTWLIWKCRWLRISNSICCARVSRLLGGKVSFCHQVYVATDLWFQPRRKIDTLQLEVSERNNRRRTTVGIYILHLLPIAVHSRTYGLSIHLFSIVM